MTKRERERVQLQAAPHEKIVQPQHAVTSDINSIMARHAKMPVGSPIPSNRDPASGQYIDMTVLPEDFMAAQNMVLDMRRAFASLPSAVRRRFWNDPYQVLRFLQDPGNYEEAVKLGLVPPPPLGSKRTDQQTVQPEQKEASNG